MAPALVAVTMAAFLPVLWNGFVAWDDARNLTGNPDYRGLGWTQLGWIFTTHTLGHYVPLTWLSFALDHVVWGMNPAGYHLTNLLLHGASTVLFFAVARRLLGQGRAFSPTAVSLGAAAAALFFSLHPLRVESVAWATERRDVLSGAWFLATVLLYLAAARATGARRRWLLSASVGAYLLALASKSIVMTLPAVLILLDVYPLRRLAADPRRWLGRSGRAVLVEKIPYVALGVAGGALGYYIQLHDRGLNPGTPWAGRVANVAYSLWFYVVKTVLPLGLSPLYEAPAQIDPLEARFLASAVGVVGASLLVLALRTRWPAGLAASTYYALVLSPVSGVVLLGPQLVADRYSYLSCLGWAMLVGAGVGALVREAERGTLRAPLVRLGAAALVAWLLGLGVLTWRQAQVWHDTESLWRQAVRVDPECATCHKFLGDPLVARGALLSGIEHYQTALALRPDRLEFRGYLGWAFLRLGAWPEAAEQYRLVLARYPGESGQRNNLAVALLEMGRVTEAIEELREALRITPDYPPALLTLEVALAARGGDHTPVSGAAVPPPLRQDPDAGGGR
jgi:hypothetical protein